MRDARPLCLAALLLAALFGGGGVAAAAAERFGAPLKGVPAVALEEIVKSPDAYSGKTVRTEGKVSAVCAKKGCWMTLAAGGKSVRVTFKDYGFFVPKDCAGATAVVEGVFKVETVPEATAKHYAEETPGANPEAVKGDQKELSIVANGVELTRPGK